MSTTVNGFPEEPYPRAVERVLADIEDLLSHQAPDDASTPVDTSLSSSGRDVSAPAEGDVSGGAGVTRRVEVPDAEVPDEDGYTARVRQWEARVAEADRIRDLPTERVLTREQELAEEDALRLLDTEAHAGRLRAASDRDRAELQAQASSAAARRRLDADVDVRALALSRKRRGRIAILWVVLGLAMAYTCVNVQEFAAHGTDSSSPLWWVAWGVDPLLSALVVALLLTRGDVATYGHHTTTPDRAAPPRWRVSATTLVEVGALLAVLVMNVAPEASRTPGARWQLVVLHIVVPLAAVAAAVVLPRVQRHYATAITTLYATAPDPTVHSGLTGGLTGALTGPEYRENTAPAGESSARSPQALAGRARELIASGELPPDPSAALLRRVLRCATTTASQVRDELRRGAA